MKILFDNEGYGINASAATYSVIEWFSHKGMIIDFDKKIIQNVGNSLISQYDKNYLKDTYAYFNLEDFEIINNHSLQVDKYKIIFDFENTIFNVNDKKIKIEGHNDWNKPILKVFKTKIKVYEGLQGLVKVFTEDFFKNSRIDLLKKVEA